jgi:copper(I)-binding protein
MSKSNRFGWMTAALLVSFASYAGDLEVSNAWTRATAPGQDAASVDLTIVSKQDAALVGASSPASKTAALHSMTMEGGMMRMREVNAIKLPAGKTINLQDGGYHLMLEGLKSPLKEGEAIPLTLTIKTSSGVNKVETSAKVGSLTATGAPAMEHEHMHMKMN